MTAKSDSILPLYKGAKEALTFKAVYNRGLYFERFFNDTEMSRKERSNKANFLESIISGAGGLGDQEQLQSMCERQFSLVSHLNGSAMVFESEWHWVTGLGNSHPLENGFTWHQTLGAPYLPGSSVKGLIRAWLDIYDEDCAQQDHKQKIKAWLGASNDDDPSAGGLIFFDALPMKRFTLVKDVMTPHTSDWYEKGDKGDEENAPADWHTPIPNYFLACKNLSLLFSFAPRPGYDLSEDERLQIEKALQNALAYLGAGAKTASGYGYMRYDPDALDQIKHAVESEKNKKAFAALTPEKQCIHELKSSYDSQTDNYSNNDIESLIEEALSWLEEDRKALYEQLERKYLDFEERKNLKSKKKKERDRRFALAERLLSS